MLKKREKTEVRKKQIVDAARKLIVRRGSEHVTIRGLAKEVGISEAAIYRHFRSKRDILSFLADDLTENLLHDVDHMEENDTPSLDAIENTLKIHFSSIEQRKGMTFQVLAEIISFGDKKLNRQVTRNIHQYIVCLEELLARGAKAGLVREDINLGDSALLLFGMIQGLVNIWALSGYDFDLMEKYSALWGVFRQAIQPNANGRKRGESSGH